MTIQKNNFWQILSKENAVLNPVDRISEVLFGLIMVLTFTGAISVSNQGREEVRDLLWAALACNLAWGLVDAIMYLMSSIIERGHAIKVIQRINQSKHPTESAQILKEELQPLIAKLLSEEELSDLARRIKKLQSPEKTSLITVSDLFSAVQIFLLVFLCTFPVAIPFVFVDNITLALKLSNATAIALLFIGGYILANYAGFKPILSAIVYAIIGVLLVFLTMALGG